MDRTWMALTNKLDERYVLGVDYFLEFAYKNRDSSSKIPCPCKCCNNYREQNRDVVLNHLLVNGIRSTYSRWIYHGEKSGYDCSDDDEMSDDGNFDNMDEELESMVNDIGRGQWGENWKEGSLDVNDENNDADIDLEKFMRLLDKSKEKLYSGCQYTILSFIVTLLHLKTSSGWSVKSFDVLLGIFRKSLPKEACIPESFYEAKKMIKDLGFTYQKIHACVNDCLLYRKDYKKEIACPKCKEPRYTSPESKVPRKVLRYFPLKPRLRRFFINKDIAENMRWHKEKRVEESGVMRHPADGEAWKHFDRVYKDFAKDSRNIRLGLATDGFNPFGNLSTSYSIWPVFLVPYNLPPWLCMKDEFSIMSMLIPGPKSPGNAIDVYLQPLIDELNELWNGVPAYDAYKKAKFTLHASLIWTISDFPAYAMLSGWSTKGYYACPVCLKETTCQYLPCSKKLCYMGHRRNLDSDDASRDAHSFDGHTDHRGPVIPKSGFEILGELYNLNLDGVSLGKLDEQARQRKRKRGDIESNWRKISVFFQLPYWPVLMLRHNLDVMHIVKNVAESLFGTIMNISGKTKDTWKSRQDLMKMGLKPELHLKTNAKGTTMPRACYQFTKDEKIKVVNFFSTIKYPDGFASNIARCVKDEEFQISNMKSHDFYILLQKLLPVAVQGSLTKDARQVIIGISSFVQKLCSKTSLIRVLEEEESNIAKLLCKMETLFPHSFFDIMLHLLVHLPYEAKLGGPPQFRWMFPFERKMGDVKPYVTNTTYPEGCIAERYIDKECTNFCSMYLKDVESKVNQPERNDSKLQPGGELSVFSRGGRPFSVSKYETLSSSELAKVHAYVLNNCDELEDYICEHKLKLKEEGCAQIDEVHDKQFPSWFRNRILSSSDCYPDELRALALGPDNRITRYKGCLINGFRFQTQSREKERKTQNSGLLVKGDHEDNLTDFLGVVQDIIELEYLVGKKKVLLFKCDWWDTSATFGMKVNPENGLKSVNFDEKWYKDQPYCLAYQAQQVFYLKDIKLGNNWHVVQNCGARSTFDVPVCVDVSPDDVYQEDEPDMTLFVDLGINMSSSLSRENEPLEVLDLSFVNGSSSVADDDVFLDEDDNNSDCSSEDDYDEELWNMEDYDSE